MDHNKLLLVIVLALILIVLIVILCSYETSEKKQDTYECIFDSDCCGSDICAGGNCIPSPIPAPTCSQPDAPTIDAVYWWSTGDSIAPSEGVLGSTIGPEQPEWVPLFSPASFLDATRTIPGCAALSTPPGTTQMPMTGQVWWNSQNLTDGGYIHQFLVFNPLAGSQLYDNEYRFGALSESEYSSGARLNFHYAGQPDEGVAEEIHRVWAIDEWTQAQNVTANLVGETVEISWESPELPFDWETIVTVFDDSTICTNGGGPLDYPFTYNYGELITDGSLSTTIQLREGVGHDVTVSVYSYDPRCKSQALEVGVGPLVVT